MQTTLSLIFIQFLQSLHHDVHGLVRHGTAAAGAKIVFMPVCGIFAVAPTFRTFWQIPLTRRIGPLATPYLLHLLPRGAAESSEGDIQSFFQIAFLLAAQVH